MIALVEKVNFKNKQEALDFVEDDLDEYFFDQDGEPMQVVDYFSIGGRWHNYLKRMDLNPLLRIAFEKEIEEQDMKSVFTFSNYFPGKKYENYYGVTKNWIGGVKPSAKMNNIKIVSKRIWSYGIVPLIIDHEDDYPTIFCVQDENLNKESSIQNLEHIKDLTEEMVVGKCYAVVVDYHY